MRRVRVLIADDQADVRRGLEVLLRLEGDIEVVGSAANGLQAVELAELLKPDVILLDLNMPHLDGFEAMRRIRDKHLPVQIVALTTHGEPGVQEAVRQGGAEALIDKAMPDTQLVEIVRAVHHGADDGPEDADLPRVSPQSP